MKALLLFLALSTSQFYFTQDELKLELQEMVTSFKLEVESNDVQTIAKRISFPFQREYPIPDIKSEEEFAQRYAEIFDDQLTKQIVSSNTQEDWSEVGWRGVMFSNGVLWLSPEGQLLAVNYQSILEQELQKKYEDKDRSNLHSSLTIFKAPVYSIETKKFKIRIDEMENGKYRYASWPISKTMLDKPDLILSNGKIEMQGSGGNHEFIFKNGDYRYIINIFHIGGPDTPPAKLTVTRKEKEILSQDGLIIRD